MKTYGYYLILHILGLTGLIAAGVLAMLHGLWFCTIICGLLLIGICYSLYRIQIRQTETMYRLVECMKQNDLGQRVCAPFADPQMQKLAEDLSQALKNLRTRIVDEEVKHQYYEMLLNKVDTAVLVTDRNNRMEWMNKAARELLGHCPPAARRNQHSHSGKPAGSTPAKGKRYFRSLPVRHAHPAARTNLPAD